MAGIVIVVIVTGGTISAGLRVTFVDFILTIGTGESALTRTIVAIYPIDACSTVHARTFCTVLVVCLTVHTTEAQFAGAGIRVHVLCTGRPILTRHRETLVDVDFAMLTLKAIHAKAGIISNPIQTSSTVLTGE